MTSRTEKQYDFVILGSGIAGLYTALLAQQQGEVLILTKGSIDDCNTRHAQGGIAAAIGPADSSELHFRDTIAAGAGLCDPEAVRILTTEAADRIHDLINFGVPFDTVNGEVALTMEAAHSVPRILHAGGDATGEHIEVTLSRAARASRRISILEHCLATEILLGGNRVEGVTALDRRSGVTLEFRCRSLIVATGGAGWLFKFTTNSEVATGDGIALAYNAGAEIADMEFFQFHPTALHLPGITPFLISEAVRGEGGILRDAHGHQFMPKYAPEGDLAPRDIVARGIVAEMRRSGDDHVYLDVTHLPARKVSARFPHIYRFCLDHGLDITTSPIPVAPAAHYTMGGIKTNSWGETNIGGLFACGETTCTGVHGANRLASNSLLEVLVFSKRILERAEEGPAPGPTTPDDQVCTLPERETSALTPPPLSPEALRSLLWDKVGIVRSGEELAEAANILAWWQKELAARGEPAHPELPSMVLVGRLMAEAALLREESRGAHFRSDYPKRSPAWERHLVFRKKPRSSHAR